MANYTISLMTALAIFCATLSLLYGVYKRRKLRQNPRQWPLPPGPKPEPIIGNARHIPFDFGWLQFAEWKKSYGDIIHLNALGNRIIVLNSYKSCIDLLGQNAIYASRPRFYVVAELMGLAKLTPFLPYNDELKQHRKFLHSTLKKSAVVRFQPAEEKQMKWYLSTLAAEPQNFLQNIRLLTGKLVAQTTYGVDVKSADDKYIVLAEKAVNGVSSVVTPINNLWNAFPILEYIPDWFPGAGVKTIAHEVREIVSHMVPASLEDVKSRTASGDCTPSLASAALESGNYSEEDIMWAAGSLYFAGADTTYGALVACIFAMVKHPEVQKKAQAEIDRVVGKGRLPTFADREQLSYIDCVIKEIARWKILVPLGLPRSVLENDYYDGYWVPKGATMLPNAWAISRDETLYEDPERFWPERFEGEAGNNAVDPFTYVFGFGRRICPGLHLADSIMFIFLTTILSTFDISKSIDEQGREMEPQETYVPGIIQCVISLLHTTRARVQLATI
ncbi:hypothetical protein BOTBODRAFT_520174 [Botryobasidium botryosum FD-172 SS1]|uniref:Cytochrome P450 n=1 Tax=Botryobasidium botryosum (strain FD-172 SS1) TaxID=930990 RepID=A0A067M279_BOTB1|nr:hypothetical protein BOTBODRAFT_520174 [Botryobasidium botryosum FD-172 SS1]